MFYFLQPMREEDIPRVQEIERLSFPTLWSANAYRRELNNRDTSRYLVVRSSQTLPPEEIPQRKQGFLRSLLPARNQGPAEESPYPIIGYGGLWLMVDEAHITTIAVAPSHRGQGIGELLLNGLIDEAIDLNASRLTLEVRISNEPAQRLYLKYGFEPSGTRPRYYNDNGEDALIMWTGPIDDDAYVKRLEELRTRLAARLRKQAGMPS